MQRRQSPEVVLAGQLTDSVGGNGTFRRPLRCRNDFGITVNHAATTGEDDPLYVPGTGSLEEVDQTEDVDCPIE